MNIIVHRTAPVVISVPSPDAFRVSFVYGSSSGGAPEDHTHEISDIDGLQTALDGKSDDGHTHTIGDVDGLQTILDNKSDDGHGHVISDVTGLQTALDGKSNTGHVHAIADVTGLQTALNDKAYIGRADNWFEMFRGLGSNIKSSQPYMTAGLININVASNLIRWSAIYVPEAATISGVMFGLRQSGVYVANAHNEIMLYSVNIATGDLTLLATTADDPNMYVATGSINIMQQRAFLTPVNIARGVYYIGVRYSSASATTAPQMNTVTMTQPYMTYDFSNGVKVCAQLAITAATPNPTTINFSALTLSAQPFVISLY